MKKILILIILSLNTFIFKLLISAQSDSNLDLDTNIGLEKINIPFFSQPLLAGNRYYTFLSWASFLGTIISFAIVAYWIFLILRAAFEALQSGSDSEKLEASFGRVRSAFIGATIALLFPIILTIIGFIFGLGPLWSWPSAFRECPSNRESIFFFQEVLLQANGGAANPVAEAEFVLL